MKFVRLALLALCLLFSLELRAVLVVESFEAPGYLNGTRLEDYAGWTEVVGTARITDADARSGSQAVRLLASSPESELERSLAVHSGSISFTELWIKPIALAPGAPSFLNVDNSVLFFYQENGVGRLYVWDGDAGTGELLPTGYHFNLDASSRASDWIRLSIRQDLLQGAWDLSIDGQAAAIELGLYGPVAQAQSLQLWGDTLSDTYLDDLSFGDENPLGADADKDGMLDAYESDNGLAANLEDRDADPDADDLRNIEEFLYGTRANDPDTDDDGAFDGYEIDTFTDPLADTGILHLYEPFSYPLGSFSTTTSTGFGFDDFITSNARNELLSDNLAFPPLVADGGSVLLKNNPWWTDTRIILDPAEANNAHWNPPSGQLGEWLWLSLIVRMPDDLSGKQLSLNFQDGNGPQYGITLQSYAGAAELFANASVDSARSLSAGETYYYLLRFQIDHSANKSFSGELWVFEAGSDALPATEAELGTPQAVLGPVTLIRTWNTATITLEYRTPSAPGGKQLSPYLLDEFRLGTSYRAIAPGSDSGLPMLEPALPPAITPLGGIFSPSVEVTLAAQTPGSDIFYTLDGSKPGTSSTLYTEPFTLNATSDVRAVASAPGYALSPVSSAAFAIVPVVATPIFSPGEGSYAGHVVVSIESETDGSQIYYTTDGTTSDTSSQLYEGPFTLTESTLVRAYAVKENYAASDVAEVNYTLTPGPPPGELYVYEPFDYSLGTIGTQAATGLGLVSDIGFGNFDSIESDSLSYQPLMTSAQHLSKGNNPWWHSDGVDMRFSDSVKELVNLNGSESETELWLSFLTRMPANLDGRSLELSLFGWGDHYGVTIDGANNEAALFIEYHGGSRLTSTARSIQPNREYCFLAKISVDKTSGKRVGLDLWVYESGQDSLPSSTPAVPQAQIPSTLLTTDWGLFQFYLAFQTPSAPNSSLDPYYFDELRLGDRFEAVMPRPPSASLSGIAVIADSQKRAAATATLEGVDSLYSESVSVASDGSFVFSNLTHGEYRLTLGAPSHLRFFQNVTVAGPGLNLGELPLIAGDLNGDGIVDDLDFLILEASYNRSAGESGYNEAADIIKNDDAVTLKDLVLLGSHWGLEEL